MKLVLASHPAQSYLRFALLLALWLTVLSCGGGGTGSGGGGVGPNTLLFRAYNLQGAEIVHASRARFATHAEDAQWVSDQLTACIGTLPDRAYFGNIFSFASGNSVEYPGTRGTVVIDGQVVQAVQPFVNVTKGIMDQVIAENASGDLGVQLQAYSYP